MNYIHIDFIYILYIHIKTVIYTYIHGYTHIYINAAYFLDPPAPLVTGD